MKHSPLPRALRNPIFAAAGESDEARILNELSTGVRGFIDRTQSTIDNVVASMEAMQRQMDSGVISGNGQTLPVEPDYTRAFASYFRKGDGEDQLRQANAAGERATIQAAMSVGDNSSGGYLAPVEWDRKIAEAQRASSPMRRLATVQATGVHAYTTLWNNNQFGSGWVGEVAARPQTTTASLSPITFASGELYAMPAATQKLLDDAAINVDAWLIQSVEKEFTRQEGIAFLSGDGVNKPAGFLTFADGGTNAASHPGGAIDVTETDITVDSLIDFTYGLPAPYRQNAAWLMSSLTAAALAKMKDDNGQLIWRESLIAGQPSTLLGRPVEIDEGMPGPAAGNLAIAYADWKAGYVINDRMGVRILRDPFTNKPYVLFYVTKRVGGGVLDPTAIRLLKVAA